MKLLSKGFGALMAAGALAATAVPASAATIIKNSGMLPTPPAPGVTTLFGIPGNALYKPANTYYFAFSLGERADWQSQIAVNYTLKSTNKAYPAPSGSFSAPLAYSLFRGGCTAVACTPVGGAVDATLPGENTLGEVLDAGSYFLKLTSVTLPALKPGWSFKVGPSLAGSYTTAAVPEPGAWALMLMGFSAAGAAFRRSRKLAATA